MSVGSWARKGVPFNRDPRRWIRSRTGNERREKKGRKGKEGEGKDGREAESLFSQARAARPLNRRDKDLITMQGGGERMKLDGWPGVVKYKVNYLTLSRYEEAHRRLNIDALVSEGKMKGGGTEPSLRFGFLIMNSALLPRGFSSDRFDVSLPSPPPSLCFL